ncbi:hypothetical protein [Massilibacteroides vaginae]|uniref:hypothetical protein n=1 Tax=Massilibacteroides vaginae TaxID=1673718 RepID=UPI0015948823|nr:hypothetical protein [Massilibacteroides vaginae]
MRTKFLFIFFILTLMVSVSSCSGDTVEPTQTEIGVEEYQDGGQYFGKLKKDSTNN